MSADSAALTQRERRAVEARVAHLPQDRADAVIDRAHASPTWARRTGLTRPVPVDLAEVAS